MRRFEAGEIDVLVATTVVEVGIDVPNATVLVVEHAERFGLGQLHQLRGRVGRGNAPGYCVLMRTTDVPGTEAHERLTALETIDDGFEIAEMDLTIRGPGELTGIHQSGRFRLTIADIVRDLHLLKAARADVERILERDPGLLEPENKVVRNVLDRAAPFGEVLTGGG